MFSATMALTILLIPAILSNLCQRDEQEVNTIKYLELVDSTNTKSTGWSMFQGPISSHLYLVISSQNSPTYHAYTTISRMTINFEVEFQKTYNAPMTIYENSIIDPSENFFIIYPGDFGPSPVSQMTLHKIDATNGSPIASIRDTSSYSSDNMFVSISPDSKTVYATGSRPTDSSVGHTRICYWSMEDLSNLYCLTFSSALYSDSLLAMSQTSAVFSMASAFFVEISYVSFTASSFTRSWTHYLTCSSTCAGVTGNIIEFENTLLHFIPHNTNVLLYQVNSNDGSLVGDRYASNPTDFGSCDEVYSGFTYESTLYFTIYCASNTYMSSYNMSDHVFGQAFKLTDSSRAYDNIIISNEVLYLFGYTVSSSLKNPYFAKAPLDSVLQVKGVSLKSPSRWTTVTSVSQYGITNGVKFNPNFASVINKDTPALGQIGSNAYTPNTEETQVSYWMGSENFGPYLENYGEIDPIELTCSINSSWSVSYSLTSPLSQDINWININDADFTLDMATPDISSDTEYEVLITARIEEDSVFKKTAEKTVYITVIACAVDYCDLCIDNADTCATCQADYLLYDSTCVLECPEGYELDDSGQTCIEEEPINEENEQDEEEEDQIENDDEEIIDPIRAPYEEPKRVQTATTVSQSVVVASLSIGAFASILAGSSPQGAWCSINLYQLLLLVPLTGAYIHPDIMAYLGGFSFAVSPFSYIDVSDLSFISTIAGWFNHQNDNDYLSSMGVEFKSTIRNMLAMAFFMTILILIHICALVPLNWCCNKLNERSRIRRHMNRLYNFFTFNLYIRTVIESFQVILLSSIHEVNEFDTSSKFKIFSLCLTFLILALAGGFTAFLIISIKVSFMYEYEKLMPYYKELYDGFKEALSSRIYFLLFVLRRAFLILIVIQGRSLPMMAKISAFFIINIAIYGYLVIVRPFASIKDNILEISNETAFFTFYGSILYFNSESRWNEYAPNCIIFTLMGSSFIGVGANTIVGIKSLSKYIKEKCNKKKSKTSPVNEIPENQFNANSASNRIRDRSFYSSSDLRPDAIQATEVTTTANHNLPSSHISQNSIQTPNKQLSKSDIDRIKHLYRGWNLPNSP